MLEPEMYPPPHPNIVGNHQTALIDQWNRQTTLLCMAKFSDRKTTKIVHQDGHGKTHTLHIKKHALYYMNYNSPF
jgi:hypothetical protein